MFPPPNRPVDQAKILHVLSEPGLLRILDLNVDVETEADVQRVAIERILAMEPGTPMPAAPEQMWERYLQAPYVGMFRIGDKRLKRLLWAMVRGVAWQSSR